MASNERFYLETELVLGLILNILELPLSTSMVSWNVSSVLVVVSLSLSWKRMFYPVFIPSWTIKRSVRSNQGRSDCFFGSVGCWTMIMEIIHYQKNNLVPQTRMLLLKYRIQIKSNHEIALYKISHLKLLLKVILVTLWDRHLSGAGLHSIFFVTNIMSATTENGDTQYVMTQTKP